LEEKRVLVVPALLEDCDLPLFLRDKKFADFRSDFDEGLETLRIAIAKFTNPHLGRIEGGEYHRDWSVDWGFVDDRVHLRFTIVKHSVHLPYSIVVQITVLGSEEATARYRAYQQGGFEEMGELVVIESVIHGMQGHEFAVILEDAHAKVNEIEVLDPKTGLGYYLTMESRRLGADTGLNILMHGEEEIRWIRDSIRERIRPLNDAEKVRLTEIVQGNMRRQTDK
jgi:hypothetical protein